MAKVLDKLLRRIANSEYSPLAISYYPFLIFQLLLSHFLFFISSLPKLAQKVWTPTVQSFAVQSFGIQSFSFGNQ
ncbi:MAG: hypothetical protein DRR08_22390 [Candidatus Parabeggiatoa sp. nov. 2]|nr:MAG: hypothetical protein DRR08_22390 [Gammaproteobacteria bacterium]